MDLSKICRYGISLLRAFPCFVPTGSLLFAVIFQNKIALIFGVMFFILDLFCGFLKNIFKNLYLLFGKDILPLLGQGTRPLGAKYCGCFITKDNLEGISTSFGMPSGHSILAIFTTVFWTLYLLDNYNKSKEIIFPLLILNFTCFSVCLSRIYLGCHTFGQIIVGGIIGLFFGYQGYKWYKKYFEKYKLSWESLGYFLVPRDINRTKNIEKYK